MPDAPGAGTLLTVAPAATDPPHLVRIALDAEQVGAARLHLAADQADAEDAVATIRARTGLVITADPDGPAARLADRIRPEFVERVLDESLTGPEVLVELARLAAERRGAVSVGGRGAVAVTVLLGALAVGLHVRAGTADLAAPAAGAGSSAADAGGPGSPIASAGRPDSGRPGSGRPSSGRPGGGAARGPREDIALIARAAGLARVAGRPPMPLAEARAMLLA